MAFGGLLVITLILISTNNEFIQAIPLLGMFALALKRIIPAMQEIYAQLTDIEYYKPSFEVIYNDLTDALFLSKSHNDFIFFQKAKSIFNNDIKLQNVSFTYPKTDDAAVKKINISIKGGTTAALVGLLQNRQGGLSLQMVGNGELGQVFADVSAFTCFYDRRSRASVASDFLYCCNVTLGENADNGGMVL